jgi:hypothetical protein
MAKFDYKRPGDEQTLEGGGSGGGYSSKNDMRKVAGMAAAETAGLGYMYKRKKDFEAGVDKAAAEAKYEKSKNYSNEGRGKKAPDTTGTSEEGMDNYSPRRATLPSRPGQNSSGKSIPPYSKDRYGNIVENDTGKVSRTIFSAGQEGNAERQNPAAALTGTASRAAASNNYQEMDTSGANPDAVRGEQYGRGAPDGMKRGGRVKKMDSGGMTSKASGASSRADGIAQRGKTKGRMC